MAAGVVINNATALVGGGVIEFRKGVKYVHWEFDGKGGKNANKDLLTVLSKAPTQWWYADNTLSSGTQSINLTSLTHISGATVDLTGLKVQAIAIHANVDNSTYITFAPSVVDPYPLLGQVTYESAALDGIYELMPDTSLVLLFDDELPVVDAGAKGITVTSGDDDAGYAITVLAG